MRHIERCEDVIEHGVRIGTLEKTVESMANTANKIYLAVFSSVLATLFNIIIQFTKK